MENIIMKNDDSDVIVQVLLAWRLWLVGAVLGALIGWGAYQLAPPVYRAQASVLVDQNLEEAWTYFSDRLLFHYLERETRKLDALAWSDETLQVVVAKVDGYDVATLRAGVLTLSEPQEGLWHFYAISSESDEAEALASAWANSFVDKALASIEPSLELSAIRAELEVANQSGEYLDAEQLEVYSRDMMAIQESSRGISPYIELYVNQEMDLPTQRIYSQSLAMLIGSAIGVMVAIWVGFWLGNRKNAST